MTTVVNRISLASLLRYLEHNSFASVILGGFASDSLVLFIKIQL